MRFALINSGLGLLATASELRKLAPESDLVIAMDPDGMPWGPREARDIRERSLALAHATARYEPDAIIVACNTGTVHALDALRAEFEPAIPVIGTVPAIKPAAAAAGSVAVWATVATAASDYLRRLIAEFGGATAVTPVACPGLATAVDAGDDDGISAAIADAAQRTPDRCAAVVLGCTEYELAAEQIALAVPGAAQFGTAAAVAAQAMRRAVQAGRADQLLSAGLPLSPGQPLGAGQPGTLTVLLSGRLASLPTAAMRYQQGRELALLPAGRDPAPGLPV